MTLDATTHHDGSARFVTGDAVHLQLRTAQLGSRMLARLIDLVAQVAIFVTLSTATPIVILLLSQTGLVTPSEDLFRATTILMVVVTVVGYPVALETLTRGRTVGKLALGLRVVRDDGGPIRFRQALTRGLVGAAIEWPGLIAPPLTWLGSVWAMAVSRQGRRLGDHAAGTLVIHERSPQRWGRMPLMPPGLAAWAGTLDLAGLDDDLALAVRHFLVRVPELREPARGLLTQRLMAEVAAVVRPAPPPGVPPWAYLAAVHAERHRRARHRLAAVRHRSAAVWPTPGGPAGVPAQRAAPVPDPHPQTPTPPLRTAVPPDQRMPTGS
ncbi:RDD family protein [Micromonospora echinofusca]|nr:RDD family protein [Micromonospora echinofusca]